MNTTVRRNLQNEILTLLMNERKLVEFHFLGNSITKSTKGIVIGFDEFRINIESFGINLSLYKQSISHISSLSGSRNVNRPRPRFTNTKNTEIRTWHSS